MALSFAGGGEISVVCIATTSEKNRFFGKPGSLAKEFESKFPEEMETLSLGVILCDVYFGPSTVNDGIRKALGGKIFSSS
jgi:hypothetical protein